MKSTHSPRRLLSSFMVAMVTAAAGCVPRGPRPGESAPPMTPAATPATPSVTRTTTATVPRASTSEPARSLAIHDAEFPLAVLVRWPVSNTKSGDLAARARPTEKAATPGASARRSLDAYCSELDGLTAMRSPAPPARLAAGFLGCYGARFWRLTAEMKQPEILAQDEQDARDRLPSLLASLTPGEESFGRLSLMLAHLDERAGKVVDAKPIYEGLLADPLWRCDALAGLARLQEYAAEASPQADWSAVAEAYATARASAWQCQPVAREPGNDTDGTYVASYARACHLEFREGLALRRAGADAQAHLRAALECSRCSLVPSLARLKEKTEQALAGLPTAVPPERSRVPVRYSARLGPEPVGSRETFGGKLEEVLARVASTPASTGEPAFRVSLGCERSISHHVTTELMQGGTCVDIGGGRATCDAVQVDHATVVHECAVGLLDPRGWPVFRHKYKWSTIDRYIGVQASTDLQAHLQCLAPPSEGPSRIKNRGIEFSESPGILDE